MAARRALSPAVETAEIHLRVQSAPEVPRSTPQARAAAAVREQGLLAGM